MLTPRPHKTMLIPLVLSVIEGRSVVDWNKAKKVYDRNNYVGASIPLRAAEKIKEPGIFSRDALIKKIKLSHRPD